MLLLVFCKWLTKLLTKVACYIVVKARNTGKLKPLSIAATKKVIHS